MRGSEGRGYSLPSFLFPLMFSAMGENGEEGIVRGNEERSS